MSAQPLLYYRSVGLHAPGDTIQAGSWGRLVLGRIKADHRFYAEYLLERIRRDEFPDSPSRMESAFAFENAEFALKWNREGGNEYLYSVQLADPVAPFHRGNMGWVDAMNEYRTFEGVEECARHYWAADDRNPDTWEIISPGGFQVVDRITRIGENGTAP